MGRKWTAAQRKEQSRKMKANHTRKKAAQAPLKGQTKAKGKKTPDLAPGEPVTLFARLNAWFGFKR